MSYNYREWYNISRNDQEQKRTGKIYQSCRTYRRVLKKSGKKVKAVILNLLYPGRCIFCGKVGESICCRCEKKMIWIREPRCMRCGKMLKDEVAEYCEDCAKRKSYITQGRSLWLHQKPVSDALYRFKYHNKRCYGSVFSEKLAEKYIYEFEQKIDEDHCCIRFCTSWSTPERTGIRNRTTAA